MPPDTLVSPRRRPGSVSPPARNERWIPAFAGMTSWVGWALQLAVALAITGAPALAHEAGWHYSPLPGEGDRAALGCTYGSSAETFACLAVRCEDDFTVGLHIHTSREGGDAGQWVLEFDKEGERFPVPAVADGSPYHARIGGDVAPIIEQLKNAGLVYVDPQSGASIDRAISLSGSLYAINQALYFCAPKVSPPVPSGDEVAPVDRQDSAGDEAGQGAAEE